MERTLIKHALAADPTDSILIQGWVRTRRDPKKFSFLAVNDGSCLANIQVVVDEGIPGWDDIHACSTGASTPVTFDGGGTLTAPIPSADGLRDAEVNIGIRPEDMTPTDSANFAFEGQVAISEKLGEVTQIYFEKSNADAAQIIAKLPGIHRNTRGTALRMTADPAKLHIFKDGRSLRYLG